MERIHELLTNAGLKEVRLVPEQGGALQRAMFACEEFEKPFKAFGGETLLECDLMVDEVDDYDSCLIERVGDFIVASRSRVVGDYSSLVEGSVLECVKDSDEEQAFIALAMDSFSERAIGPLASLIEAAKARTLKMSAGRAQELVQMMKSAGQHRQDAWLVPGDATPSTTNGRGSSEEDSAAWDRLCGKANWSALEQQRLMRQFLEERGLMGELTFQAGSKEAVAAAEREQMRLGLQDGVVVVLTYTVEGELLEAEDAATGEHVSVEQVAEDVLEGAEGMAMEVSFPRSARYGVPLEATDSGGADWALGMVKMLADDFEVNGVDTGDDSCMRFKLKTRVRAGWRKPA